MKRVRWTRGLPLVLVFFVPLVAGADRSMYRGFQFGMDLNAAVKHSGMDMSEVITIHERPARIQELTWNPERFSRTSADRDPVEQVVFSFYNGELFRMVVDYDTQKIEGLSAEDLIEAVSVRYGTATRPAVKASFPSASFSEGVTVVATWEDADNSVNLVQSPYGLRFGLIAFSKRLDALAQTAIDTGMHLDKQEAPQRQRAEEQNAQDNLNKSRLINKPRFLP